jgi:hypothetical protein
MVEVLLQNPLRKVRSKGRRKAVRRFFKRWLNKELGEGASEIATKGIRSRVLKWLKTDIHVLKEELKHALEHRVKNAEKAVHTVFLRKLSDEAIINLVVETVKKPSRMVLTCLKDASGRYIVVYSCWIPTSNGKCECKSSPLSI